MLLADVGTLLLAFRCHKLHTARSLKNCTTTGNRIGHTGRIHINDLLI